ncbi:hypothetical protein SDC9_136644 [bioreactor metagenome]|uniref:Uncharacterized protein n=1 Tax=bioreactor metagenome TaxID=1076179 RepID=A0A645DJU3_9ZZZZ
MNYFCTRPGQVFRTGAIDPVRHFLIGFSLIHSRIGCTVDDVLNGVFRYKVLYLPRIGNIQHICVGIDKPKGGICFFCQLFQFLSQLSVCTGDQNVFLNQSVKDGLFPGDSFRSAKMFI